MRKYINEKFPHFLHGGDYNPEQWIDTKEIWDKDMELMKEANCNEMTVGIFSWANLEPREGEFDFSFLDEIIDKVYKAGGRVVLATPSGARPRWLAEKYPEVLRVNQDGVRNKFGVRHNHCYTSPVYREKVRIINTKLAERYGKHPAVVAWHLSNEYGGKCYCPLCENAFREYVKKKFDGDINKLNLQYWSTFWSHRYDSFDQIEFPVPRGEQSIHGLNLDMNRFISDQTIDFMNEEAKAIRAVCPDLPLTTNMMPGVRYPDYYKMAEKLDVASWDSYPNWNGPNHDEEVHKIAFWHEFFRSLKDRPFMLMESSPALQNWKEYNKMKRPGMDRLAALQAVAHGSDTVQYFQWRKSRGSVEKFHGAVVDHVGTSETRVFKAVQDTGATLKAIDEVCGSTVNAKVAIIYDYDNRWALDDAQGFARKNKGYSSAVLRCYKPLYEKGIPVDIINSHGDFSKYDLVIAPMLYMTDEDTIKRITEYVENGGTFYTTYMLGMVNENDLCYLGGFPANELKNVFGIWNEEIDTLYPDERFTVNAYGKEYKGKDYCEFVHLRGAKALVTYANDFYDNSPALTLNVFGQGKAYYQTFRDTGEFYDDTLDMILTDLDIKPLLKAKLPKGVYAHARQDDDTKYVFVQNYTKEPVTVELDYAMTDLESGEKTDKCELKAYDVRVFVNR